MPASCSTKTLGANIRREQRHVLYFITRSVFRETQSHEIRIHRMPEDHKAFHNVFFSYGEVRFGAGLPNRTAPYTAL